MRRAWGMAACAAALGLLIAGRAGAGMLELTSDGRLGDFTFEPGSRYAVNTNDGKVYWYWSGYSGAVAMPTESRRILPQADGPEIMVFDFASLTIPAGVPVELVGARAAAIATTGDVSIAGTLTVWAGGGAGGAGGDGEEFDGRRGESGASGGAGGGGPGGRVQSLGAIIVAATGGGGGGGGGYSPGEPGMPGRPVPRTEWDGREWAVVETVQLPAGAAGAARPALDVLVGGGGGGGGGYAFTDYGYGGMPGGRGGGAVLFDVAGDFHVAEGGELRADGEPGGALGIYPSGEGGGGGGGHLAFNVDGVWRNDGRISAVGGAGGHSGGFNDPGEFYKAGGPGGGGYIDIDPLQIINAGVIDLSGGDDPVQPARGGYLALDGAMINHGQIIGAVPEPATIVLILVATAVLIPGRYTRLEPDRR